MQRRPVNGRQLEVLQWVGAGCPERAWPDETYKITARALESRGLVSVSRRGGSWAAVITTAGEHFLQHGEYPGEPGPGPAAEQTTPNTANAKKGVPQRAAATKKKVERSRPSDAPSPSRSTDLALVEEIIGKVVAAGGPVDLGTVSFHANALEALARQASNRPSDQLLRLEVYGGWAERKCIAYLEQDLSSAISASSVPLPLRVARPHPAVSAYKTDVDRRMVSNASAARAVQLLQALAVEATRRGHLVTARQAPEIRYTTEFRRSLRSGQLEITVGGHVYGLLMEERPGKGGERHNYMSSRHSKLPRWQQARQYTFVPTGLLALSIVSASERDGRRVTFADSARRSLDVSRAGFSGGSEVTR